MPTGKRWLVVPVAAGLVGVSVLGGTALAQNTGGTATPTPPSNTQSNREQDLANILAKDLGVDVSKVQAALADARSQIAETRIQNFLDKAVKSGKLTQAQADALKKWYDSRPTDVPLNLFGRIGGRGGPEGHRGFGTPAKPRGSNPGTGSGSSKPSSSTSA